MKRGPKKSPDAILKLRNSRELSGRKQAATGDVLAAAPAAPDWLGTVAAEKWNELAPALVRRRILADTDLDRLAEYSVCWERWRLAESMMKETGGEVIEHKNGVAGQNHWLKVSMDMIGKLERLSSLLGLSPADRAAIKTDATPVDSLDVFLTKKHG